VLRLGVLGCCSRGNAVAGLVSCGSCEAGVQGVYGIFSRNDVGR
jgi:hypothetical protein